MASASEKESDASCRHQKIKYIKELKQKKKRKKTERSRAMIHVDPEKNNNKRCRM